MNEWRSPPELNFPVPRSVKMSQTYKLSIYLVLVICVFPTIFLSTIAFVDFNKREALKSRGVDIDGLVKKMYITKSNGSDVYNVDYVYSPKELLHSLYPSVTGKGVVSEKNYYSLTIGGPVAVIYDPLKPEKSLLNIDDAVRSSNPRERLEFLLFISAAFPIFGMAIVLAIFLPSYLKEKKLLQFGNVAAATIVGEKEEWIGKGGWASKVTYSFIDAYGHAVTGVQKYLPAKNDQHNGAYRERIFQNQTALYDPLNSVRSVLYPPRKVTLG